MTAQFGAKNKAIVNQAMAVPLSVGDNNSFITQVGGSNVVNAAQTTGQQASAGNNTQVAMQVGTGNMATVTQATGASVPTPRSPRSTARTTSRSFRRSKTTSGGGQHPPPALFHLRIKHVSARRFRPDRRYARRPVPGPHQGPG